MAGNVHHMALGVAGQAQNSSPSPLEFVGLSFLEFSNGNLRSQ
jgi:hypothetical protein